MDDDSVSREVMRYFVENNPDLNFVRECSNAIEASEVLSNGKIDLVLLDIEMPGMSGMELIKYSKKLPQVIFVTAHNEYAVEAFEYDVTDYLVKPVSEDRFAKAINKAVKLNQVKDVEQVKDNYLYIKVNSELIKINCEDIVFIESYGDYIKINTLTERFVVLGTMNGIQNDLPENSFMRIHRKYILRLDKIAKIEKHNVHLTNKEEIQVSRTIKPELLARIKSITN